MIVNRTVGSLAVIDVHARDMARSMSDGGVSSPEDFDWIKQMRYYWKKPYDAMPSNGNCYFVVPSILSGDV